MKKLVFILSISLFFSCQNQAQTNPKQKEIIKAKPVVVPLEDGKAKAYFASGCFWCVEAIYESVKGVEEVISGFSGGHTDDITHEKSHSGRTGHPEAVEVV
jgi:peptide-methionine (S)-S-oxide reductase